MTEAHELTEAGARTFRDAGVPDDERDRWLAAGFGPLASLNYIRAGATVDDAVLARSLGLDSRSIASDVPSGVRLESVLTALGDELDLDRADLVELVRHAGSMSLLRRALRAGMPVETIREFDADDLDDVIDAVESGASVEAAIAVVGAAPSCRQGPSDRQGDVDDVDETDDRAAEDDEDDEDGWADDFVDGSDCEVEEVDLAALGFGSLAEFAASLDPDDVAAGFGGALLFVIDGRPMVAVVVDGEVVVEPSHASQPSFFDPGSIIEHVLAGHRAIENNSMCLGTSLFTIGTTSSGLIAAYDEIDGNSPELEVWRPAGSPVEELLRWFHRIDTVELLPALAAEALAAHGSCDTVGAALDEEASDTLELGIHLDLSPEECADLLKRFDSVGWGAARRAVAEPGSEEAIARAARRRLLGLDD
ncbi:MAG: hypothetical protein F2534_21185 [Actinobacteria bacterium]|uniref:Unannotated protein n=1 Tax=freshwater metagenome TaxID=449393 RepID=A0A6J6G8Z9_9ZZZZ|nr:hypothetical protein [Actinomycetota bacterium]